MLQFKTLGLRTSLQKPSLPRKEGGTGEMQVPCCIAWMLNATQRPV